MSGKSASGENRNSGWSKLSRYHSTSAISVSSLLPMMQRSVYGSCSPVSRTRSAKNFAA